MKLNTFDASRGQFVNVDAGQVGTEALLLNILIELRIHSLFLQAMNPQIKDDLSALRADVVNDPPSFAATSL